MIVPRLLSFHHILRREVGRSHTPFSHASSSASPELATVLRITSSFTSPDLTVREHALLCLKSRASSRFSQTCCDLRFAGSDASTRQACIYVAKKRMPDRTGQLGSALRCNKVPSIIVMSPNLSTRSRSFPSSDGRGCPLSLFRPSHSTIAPIRDGLLFA